MKTIAYLVLGSGLLAASVGCHCFHGGCGPQGCGSYYSPGYAPAAGGCPTGNCGPTYPGGTMTYPPQGAFQTQPAYPTANAGIVPTTAIQPISHQSVAMSPLEPLPTY